MFRQKKKTYPSILTLSDYPVGLFIETENGFFMVVSGERRYRFSTGRVLNSWNPQSIVQTTESHPAVKKLKVGGKMKFRNGSLLHCQADGKMYLISDNQTARHIVDPSILTALNLRRQDAVWVSESEIKLHRLGEPLG